MSVGTHVLKDQPFVHYEILKVSLHLYIMTLSGIRYLTVVVNIALLSLRVFVSAAQGPHQSPPCHLQSWTLQKPAEYALLDTVRSIGSLVCVLRETVWRHQDARPGSCGHLSLVRL